MKDTIQQALDSIQGAPEIGLTEIISEQDTGYFHWWLLVVALALMSIVFLFFKLRSVQLHGTVTDQGLDLLGKAKSQDIDMTNLMNNINFSRDLYSKLSRKCHPDRFQDELLKNIAENLFQEISKHKRNYAKLVELKKVAEEKLHVKF